MFLGDNGCDGWIMLGFWIRARFCLQVGCLKDHIRFMIAELSIHRSNNREPIQHGGLLRQVLANANTRQLGWNRSKWTTIVEWPVGFWIPSIDLAWASCHPQQNDTFLLATSRAAGNCITIRLK